MWHMLAGPTENPRDGPPDAKDNWDLEREDVPMRKHPDRPELIESLREVIDPELGINIVDLGLVYAIRQTGDRVEIAVTLTTPACPLSGVIVDEVRHQLEPITDRPVQVDVVWEPKWSPQMMSETAKSKLQA